MPNLPDDRYQHENQRRRRFVAQPPYREARAAWAPEPALSWAELDRLPAGTSPRRGLTTR